MRFWSLALAAFTAASALPVQAASPPTVTLAELHARPWVYAHKTILIRGRMNECAGLSCELCPEDAHLPAKYVTERCLGVAFGLTGDRGFVYDAQPRMDEAYRFATITVEAVFEPACLTGTLDGRTHREDGDVPEVICMDRSTTLRQARVRAVHARQTINDGLVTSTHYSPVVAAKAGEAEAMIAAWREAQPWEDWTDQEEAQAPRAFLIQDADMARSPIESSGMVCVCLDEAGCESRWPVRWGAGFRSPANPYDCNYVAKVGGRWRATY